MTARHLLRRTATLPLLAFLTCSALAFAACGGGDGDESGFGGAFGDRPTTAADTPGNGGSNAPTTGETGPAPNISADPGQARIEVDGKRIEFGGNNILYYICDVGEAVQINMQTGEGHDLLLTYISGNGSLTARDTEEDVYYAATISQGRGFWIEGNSVIYSGTLQKQQGSNRLDSENLDGTLVVNCDPPGGEHAQVEIDGETYTIPASGTQSYVCEVGDRFTVNIQPQRDGGWLQIEARQQGETWLGSATLRLEETTYFSQIPNDGEGLEVDGKRITYSGTFELRDSRTRDVIRENIEGTVRVSCP
jgi:hypothetical protein